MTSELWNFSISRYGRTEVPDLCIAMQDRYAADVNILLFLLWAGSTGHRINREKSLDVIDGAVGAWHKEIVRPLRAVRRRLKSWPVPDDPPKEAVRKRLNAVEIETEKLEQEILYALVRPAPQGFWSSGADPECAMIDNLLDYLQHLSAPIGDARDLGERLAALCR